MSASVATKKDTKVSLATQKEGDMSVTTSDRKTSLSISSQHAASTFPPTQGKWKSVTILSSPTPQQNIYAKHEILVVIAGNSVSFHCTSPVDVTFRWNYWSLGGGQSMLIYNGDRISNRFYRVDRVFVSICDTRNCILTIGDLQPYDTGTLACLGGTVDKYWSFTILG